MASHADVDEGVDLFFGLPGTAGPEDGAGVLADLQEPGISRAPQDADVVRVLFQAETVDERIADGARVFLPPASLSPAMRESEEFVPLGSQGAGAASGSNPGRFR